MLPLLIGMSASFGVGIVFFEVIRHAGFPEAATLPVLWWGVGGTFVFLADHVITHFLERLARSRNNPDHPVKILYYRLIGTGCLLIIATIPLLWWGVIERLARVPGH